MVVYRQGDIILEPVKKPKFYNKVTDILSIKGETGHAHILPVPVMETAQVRGFKMPLMQFVEVGKGGALMTHEEHPPLRINEGTYQVKRVRTFEPDVAQRFTDVMD